MLTSLSHLLDKSKMIGGAEYVTFDILLRGFQSVKRFCRGVLAYYRQCYK